MSKRNWVPIFALAVIVGAVASVIYYVSQHPVVLQAYPSVEYFTLTECQYDAKRAAADDAKERERQQYNLHSPARFEASKKARDAEDEAKRAKECEERLGNRSDLTAQWHSAIAAKNSVEIAIWLRTFAVFEFMLLAATLVAAGWAAWEASKANGQNSEQSRRELRAYVHLREIEYSVVDDRGIAHYMFLPKWENTGDTPTKNLVHETSWEYMGNGFPLRFSFPTVYRASDPDGPSVNIIGPGHAIFGPPALVRELQFMQVENGSLYIWGYVEYDDVFSGTERHRTEFAFRAVRTMVKDEVKIIFVPLKQYNGADKDCMHAAAPYPYERVTNRSS